jgi:hypothetical protein
MLKITHRLRTQKHSDQVSNWHQSHAWNGSHPEETKTVPRSAIDINFMLKSLALWCHRNKVTKLAINTKFMLKITLTYWGYRNSDHISCQHQSHAHYSHPKFRITVIMSAIDTNFMLKITHRLRTQKHSNQLSCWHQFHSQNHSLPKDIEHQIRCWHQFRAQITHRLRTQKHSSQINHWHQFHV